MNITEMIGKTFTKVKATEDELIFENETEVYTFMHYSDCCEHVYIESVVGELSDLENKPILFTDEVSFAPSNPEDYSHESVTWTFYKFATSKGWVDIRWCGSSNGYYSEAVSIKHEMKEVQV